MRELDFSTNVGSHENAQIQTLMGVNFQNLRHVNPAPDAAPSRAPTGYFAFIEGWGGLTFEYDI